MRLKITFLLISTFFVGIRLFSQEFDNQIFDDPTLVAAENQEAELAYNLGVTQFGNGEYEKALESFGKSISYDGNFAKAYLNRGSTYMQLKIMEMQLPISLKLLKLQILLGSIF